MAWHTTAQGFLFMDDDTVLNYWTMTGDDKVNGVAPLAYQAWCLYV